MTAALSAVAPISAGDVGVYAARTLIVVAFLVIAFRIFGKREMAQLNVYDLAMLMALANAVQNAMTGGRGNLAIGLASSATVLMSAYVVTKLVAQRPSLEHRLVGWPTVIVNNGVVQRRHMRRERVTTDELAEAVRSHGLGDVGEVRLAVLEVDGSITIVPLDSAEDAEGATGASAAVSGRPGSAGRRRSGKARRGRRARPPE